MKNTIFGGGRKTTRNSQQQIIDYLKTTPYATERDIQEVVWDYYRYTYNKGEANKKYADILRRALYSGKLERVRMQVKGVDTRKYWYYCLAKK
jgi:hypothetical protein